MLRLFCLTYRHTTVTRSPDNLVPDLVRIPARPRPPPPPRDTRAPEPVLIRFPVGKTRFAKPSMLSLPH